MDGLFLACLMGICGSPASPPPGETRAERPVEAHLAASPSVSKQMVERPMPPGQPVQIHQVQSQPVQTQPVQTQIVPERANAGNLSKAAIAEIVRQKSPRIRRCYELGLAEDPLFKGTIEVGWKIQMNGRVSSVNLVSSARTNNAAEDCLLAEIIRWQFPAASEPIVVGTYPFVFDASLLARHNRSR